MRSSNYKDILSQRSGNFLSASVSRRSPEKKNLYTLSLNRMLI